MEMTTLWTKKKCMQSSKKESLSLEFLKKAKLAILLEA
jgi:hypothetical protein